MPPPPLLFPILRGDQRALLLLLSLDKLPLSLRVRLFPPLPLPLLSVVLLGKLYYLHSLLRLGFEPMTLMLRDGMMAIMQPLCLLLMLFPPWLIAL